MSKHYLRASQDVLKICQSIIDEHYKPLRSARVTVEALTVHSDKEGEPALTLRGRPCGAIIRKTSTKERVAGRADAEIILDRAYYQELTERQRRALLHHELHHLEVCYDKHDEIKRDTSGRPVLSMREHDYEVGWFHNIAEIYGEDSGEVMQARKLIAGKLGQIYFNFPEQAAAASGGPLDGMRRMVNEQDGVESITISSPDFGGVKIDKDGVHRMPPADKKESDDDSDVIALIPKALDVIKDLQRASVSGVQRRLRIGYNRACRIFDALEKLGVVGPDNGSEPREILVDLDTYKLPTIAAA